MKLRIYASVLTWMMTAGVVAAGMWYGTRKDVLEIYTIVMMFTPFSGLAVMALTEPKEKKLTEDEKRARRRNFRIYTLKEDGWHERKVG